MAPRNVKINFPDLKRVLAHFKTIIYYKTIFFFSVTAAARVKRQDDEGEDQDQTNEELCQDRPADEYFRLTTDGDCRDVVR